MVRYGSGQSSGRAGAPSGRGVSVPRVGRGLFGGARGSLSLHRGSDRLSPVPRSYRMDDVSIAVNSAPARCRSRSTLDASGQQPAASGPQPAARSQQPAASSQQPARRVRPSRRQNRLPPRATRGSGPTTRARR
ncbi:hypothetical protein FM119_12450 [Mycetocola reblochoni REB411]|uniref:Uncharacterized protein n=1 Tax=Mycetocola reblochoni REB411 TaxID=1255698 RepID=A0A1R4KA31_9MICO|nr:hypothetical protein FM119_12450 [Mycetocola reblochoni REB411]